VGNYSGTVNASLRSVSSLLNVYGTYIYGELEITESIGVVKNRPKELPRLTLKSTDGTITRGGWIQWIGENNYYYDVFINDLPGSKSYYLEVELTNTYNIGNKRSNINIDINSTSGVYGTSYMGRPLQYHKIGNGENILFVVSTIHGWEDNWAHDGAELTQIAGDLTKNLRNHTDKTLFDKWTIYVLPEGNPDGVRNGYTHNGPGRNTMQGYDMNRVFATSNFRVQTNARNFTGDRPFLAQEARAIRDLMLNVKDTKKGQIVLVDLHGWLDETIGDPAVGSFYNREFGNRNNHAWGAGYLVTWAREILGARASLVELPNPRNWQDILSRDFSGKFTRATINLLNTLDMGQRYSRMEDSIEEDKNKILLAGILKKEDFSEWEVENIIQNVPSSNGVWIEYSSREYLLNLFNSVSGAHYEVDTNGYLVLQGEGEPNIYDKKINNLINGDKTIIIDIDRVYYSKFDTNDEIVRFLIENDEYKITFKPESNLFVFILGAGKYNEKNVHDSKEYLVDLILKEFPYREH
jgi:hypothetical protein